MSFAQTWVASRRLFILRLLVEYGGSINESLIRKSAEVGGFSLASAADIRGDLDHLEQVGCTTQEFLGKLRVVNVTERGEDAAYGRVDVDGVEKSRWDRR